MPRIRHLLAPRFCGALWGVFAFLGALDATRASPPRLEYIEFSIPRSPGPSERRSARATTGLPVIVAFHGLGDRPESFAHLFDRIRVSARVWIPKGPLARPNGGYGWFATRVRSKAQKTLAKEIQSRSQAVHARLSRDLAARGFRAPPIVTGFSQGAMLSLALAARYPQAYRAALPIGGMLPRALWPSRAGRLPIFAFHGGQDRIIPFAGARRTLKAFATRGYPTQMHPFPNLRHEVGPKMRVAWETALTRTIRQAAQSQESP